MSSRTSKTPLLLLAIAAFVSSKVLFLFFNDPEGSNLLITTVVAGFIFLVSWATYVRLSLNDTLARWCLALVVQIATTAVLYSLDVWL